MYPYNFLGNANRIPSEEARLTGANETRTPADTARLTGANETRIPAETARTTGSIEPDTRYGGPEKTVYNLPDTLSKARKR